MEKTMKEEKPHLYEGMYVVSATLSEDARSKALDKIQQGITSRGGNIEKLHQQGRKRLAYPIENHREGYYFLIYFNLKPGAINELWQEYHLNEDLIRFITLRASKVLDKIEFKTLEEPQ
jgi:small subunit ribosomal protein S6